MGNDETAPYEQTKAGLTTNEENSLEGHRQNDYMLKTSHFQGVYEQGCGIQMPLRINKGLRVAYCRIRTRAEKTL